MNTTQIRSQSFELAWAEEFDQNEILDPQIWGFEEGYVRNNEKQYYTRNRPENVRIENDQLIIRAKKEPLEGYGYTSASLTTQGRKEFLYGRIEVKAKLPEGRGIWPAIWMLGADIEEVGWPACGEIDIMEFVGFDPDKIHGNIHTTSFNHTLETNKGDFIKNETLSSAFHIYAIEWTPEKIDFFFDDQKYFTFKKEEGFGNNEWPFDKPQYLILNVAVGGFWGGKEGIDDTIFPQEFLIDYIRYYTLKEK